VLDVDEVLVLLPVVAGVDGVLCVTLVDPGVVVDEGVVPVVVLAVVPLVVLDVDEVLVLLPVVAGVDVSLHP